YDQRAPVAGGFPVAVDRLGREFGASVVVHRCAGGVLIGRGVVFAVDGYRGIEAQVRDAVVLHCRTDRPRAPHVDRFERGGADPEVVVGGRQVEHGGAPLHRLDEGADVAHVADVGGVITVRVRVEVEADHLHAHGGQHRLQMRADETGAADDEYLVPSLQRVGHCSLAVVESALEEPTASRSSATTAGAMSSIISRQSAKPFWSPYQGSATSLPVACGS